MIIEVHAVTSRRNMRPRAVTFRARQTESWPDRIMKAGFLAEAAVLSEPAQHPRVFLPPRRALENTHLKVNRLTTRINIEDFEQPQG